MRPEQVMKFPAQLRLKLIDKCIIGPVIVFCRLPFLFAQRRRFGAGWNMPIIQLLNDALHRLLPLPKRCAKYRIPFDKHPWICYDNLNTFTGFRDFYFILILSRNFYIFKRIHEIYGN